MGLISGDWVERIYSYNVSST